MLPTNKNSEKSSDQQNRTIFNIYNIYRLVLSLLLLISFLINFNISFLGDLNPRLFYGIAWAYVIFNSLTVAKVLIPQHKLLEFYQYVVVIIVDIIILAIISYTCGGIASGMALLLLIPVAAGSIIFNTKKISIFFASVATLTTFYTEIYLSLSLNSNLDFLFQAGLLGLVLFAISLLLQYLKSVIQRNELLAREQAESIQSLEEMNFQIIQRMQTGIMVVNDNNEVLTVNSSAQKLLMEHTITSLPSPILSQLDKWKLNNNCKIEPFKITKSSPQIQTSFSYLNPEDAADVLIFLEDYSMLASRVQHLKLMSLGRLTASIAHEVRNPLGAISHASQLLNESPKIDQSDVRLVEIIDTHSKRVNSIIDNIMQLSRNKSSAPDLISLRQWLNSFIEKLANTTKEKLYVELDLDPHEISVRFNQSQLEQTLSNLCENGIRASLQNTQKATLLIRVRINPYNQNPVLEVIDNGSGITTENEDKIFEPFYTTENSGTGLGLFICKEICEANQAQLSYRRNENQQTCFVISFAHPDRNIS